MENKFTFRKERVETGLAGVGYPNPSTVIKLEGKPVGEIIGPCWASEDSLWRVRLAEADKSEYRGWKMVTLKAKFDSEPEARKYLNENFERVVAIGLHKVED